MQPSKFAPQMGNSCIYCNRHFGGLVRASREHVLPKSLAGFTPTPNVCGDCNNLFSEVDNKLATESYLSVLNPIDKLILSKTVFMRTVSSGLIDTFWNASNSSFRIPTQIILHPDETVSFVGDNESFRRSDAASVARFVLKAAREIPQHPTNRKGKKRLGLQHFRMSEDIQHPYHAKLILPKLPKPNNPRPSFVFRYKRERDKHLLLKFWQRNVTTRPSPRFSDEWQDRSHPAPTLFSFQTSLSDISRAILKSSINCAAYVAATAGATFKIPGIVQRLVFGCDTIVPAVEPFVSRGICHPIGFLAASGHVGFEQARDRHTVQLDFRDGIVKVMVSWFCGKAVTYAKFPVYTGVQNGVHLIHHQHDTNQAHAREASLFVPPPGKFTGDFSLFAPSEWLPDSPSSSMRLMEIEPVVCMLPELPSHVIPTD